MIVSLIQAYNGNTHTFFITLFGAQGVLCIFRDFEQIYEIMQSNHPYTSILPVAYFPFSFLLARLYHFSSFATSLTVFLTTFSLFFLWYCGKYLYGQNKLVTFKNIIIFTFFSYPFLFSFQRANNECILFMMIAMFVYFYNYRKLLSILFLVMAIAMKGYPAVFLLLYLSDKRYKEMAYVIFAVIGLTLISYSILDGGLFHNIKLHLVEMNSYNTGYVVGNLGLGYGNSLYGGIKAITAYYYPAKFFKLVGIYFQLMPIISLAIFLMVALYILMVERTFWKKVALLVLVAILLPYVSADYKLLLVFIPMVLFINEAREKRTDLVYAFFFILLLAPKYYYYFIFDNSLNTWPYFVNISVIINPLIILVMIGLIIGEGVYQYIVRTKSVTESVMCRV